MEPIFQCCVFPFLIFWMKLAVRVYVCFCFIVWMKELISWRKCLPYNVTVHNDIISEQLNAHHYTTMCYFDMCKSELTFFDNAYNIALFLFMPLKFIFIPVCKQHSFILSFFCFCKKNSIASFITFKSSTNITARKVCVKKLFFIFTY